MEAKMNKGQLQYMNGELQTKITELQGKLEEAEKGCKAIANDRDMSDGCLDMVAEALAKVGCCHGHDIELTPPMSYSDMIYCAVAKREKQIADLTAKLKSPWITIKSDKDLPEKKTHINAYNIGNGNAESFIYRGLGSEAEYLKRNYTHYQPITPPEKEKEEK
jgi:hypothetical protein